MRRSHRAVRLIAMGAIGCQVGCFTTRWVLPPPGKPNYPQAKVCAHRCETDRERTLRRLAALTTSLTPRDRYEVTHAFDKCFRACPGVSRTSKLNPGSTTTATLFGLILGAGAVIAGVYGFWYLVYSAKGK